MRENVLRLSCDVCSSEEGVESFTIRRDAQETVECELCERHAAPILKVMQKGRPQSASSGRSSTASLVGRIRAE